MGFLWVLLLIILSHGFTSKSHRYMLSLCANLKWYECCMSHFQGGGSASECFRDQALCCYRIRGSFISLLQNHRFVNLVIGWMVRPGEMNLGWCGVELEAGMAGTLWRAFWSEVEIQQGKDLVQQVAIQATHFNSALKPKLQKATLNLDKHPAEISEHEQIMWSQTLQVSLQLRTLHHGRIMGAQCSCDPCQEEELPVRVLEPWHDIFEGHFFNFFSDFMDVFIHTDKLRNSMPPSIGRSQRRDIRNLLLCWFFLWSKDWAYEPKTKDFFKRFFQSEISTFASSPGGLVHQWWRSQFRLRCRRWAWNCRCLQKLFVEFRGCPEFRQSEFPKVIF